MKISIQTLSIESIELFFLFDHQHQPTIEIKGIQYSSLGNLLQILPQIYDEQNLEKLAQIANFLAKGLEFQYIENTEFFKETYFQQLEAEQSDVLDETPKLRDYGIFDLSDLHAPLLKDNKLIFFVKQDYLSIPYKATLFHPILDDPLHISYELLPLLSINKVGI